MLGNLGYVEVTDWEWLRVKNQYRVVLRLLRQADPRVPTWITLSRWPEVDGTPQRTVR